MRALLPRINEHIKCAAANEWTPEDFHSLMDELTKVIEKQDIQLVYDKEKHKMPIKGFMMS